MEMGSSDIAKEMGITLDSGWSSHMEVSRQNEDELDFYFETIETARNNSSVPVSAMGHWNGFSAFASMQQPSMKYTIPLIASDGTVYGVLGIGIMKKTFFSLIPSNDFFNESACYILAYARLS